MRMESAVDLLRRQYMQLLEPDKVTMPPSHLMRIPQVQRQIYETMFQEGNPNFLPPDRYKLRILKRIIESMEKAIEDPEEDEISNDIVACFAELISQVQTSVSPASQEKCYVTYTAPLPILDAPFITLLEARSVIASSGTTGLRTWEAALSLGHFLYSTEGKPYVAGRRIIELGAGTGFLAILCAKSLGADTLLATDGSKEIINDLQYNIYMNGLGNSGKIHTSVLEWGQPLSSVAQVSYENRQEYDLIIGADVIYDHSSIPSLVSTICELFSLYPHATAIIAATVRNEKTFDTFMTACSLNQFFILELSNPVTENLDQLGFFHSTSVPVRILKITKLATKGDNI